MIRTLNDPDILSTIIENGDMDRPGMLVKKLIKNKCQLYEKNILI
jgi:hypothetical protein